MKTKWLPSGIGLIFLLLVITCLPQIHIDNSLKRWVPEGSAGINHYRHFLDTFGGDAMLIMAFEILWRHHAEIRNGVHEPGTSRVCDHLPRGFLLPGFHSADSARYRR